MSDVTLHVNMASIDTWRSTVQTEKSWISVETVKMAYAVWSLADNFESTGFAKADSNMKSINNFVFL